MKIIKRDGRAVDYNREKIEIAIQKANKEVRPKERATKEEIREIIKYIEELGKKRMLVEDIQDIIEAKLMEIGKYELSKKYIVYRYTRALVRKQNTTDESILGIIRNDKKEIVERRIYVVDNPYMQNNQYPYVQNSTYPICKKSKDNIINNNMLDSFFNYIINKEKQIPKEFENLESEILDVLEKYEMIFTEEIIGFMKPENIEKVKVISYSLALTVKENVSHLLYKMNREQIISLYDECKLRESQNKDTDNEIINFTNYYYKSLKGQLLRGKSPSFFMPKNKLEENKSSEEDEEGEEL